MSTFLGANPVDPTMAFRAAIESSLDVMSSVNECAENSRDYAKNVTITLFGDPIPNQPGNINLTSVSIEDDGQGMDFPTLTEKFRGAYFDSNSHIRKDQSGRNGVGVKTNLQYWKEIHVQTSTKGLITPKEQWLCINPDEIEQVYQKVSKLKPGEQDTELRSMILRVEGAELLDFKTVPRDDSGTIVILKGPRSPIVFNIEAFIKRQSHCIAWLSKPEHTLTVVYKNDQNKTVKKLIRPFFEMDGKDSFICHIKGNSKEDMYVIYHDQKGTKQSMLIPADKSPVVGSIDLDLKVLDRDSDSTNPNELILSVCGANIYDQVKGKTSVSPSIEYLMRQHHFKSTNGFSYRLHGYVQTDDARLKRALRHNKSVLDEEDRYARAFIDYIVSILKPLNQHYVESLNITSDKDSVEVLEEISKEFNAVMQRVGDKARQKKKEQEKTDTPVSSPKHKEFKCNDCGLVWKVNFEKNPSYCTEFNIDKGVKGCGSRDIDRNTHAKNDTGIKNIQFKWTGPIGGFIPARYEPNENTILLVTDHPSFITTLAGAKALLYKKTVGIEKSFIAIAAYKATVEDRAIEEIYGELLKEWFENKSNRDPHKVECRKVWKAAGISIDQL
jgi:hypothetical protein